MATYNYTLETFLATPMPSDTKMRIFDKNRVLKYTLTPELSYFYVKNNLVIIKQENQADIILNFIDNPTAILALAKLNDAKKTLSQQIPAPTGSEITYSVDNLNMAGLVTINDGDLCCATPVIGYPQSAVKVFINGVEVNVGATLDCYFSPDGGTTKRTLLNVIHGDKLYWNGTLAGFQIDTIDLIDFEYLIKK